MEQEKTKLSDVKEKVLEYLKENPIELYFDYRDELCKEQIEKLFKDSSKVQESLWDLENDIIESNFEYLADLQDDLVLNVKKEFNIRDEDSDELSDFVRENLLDKTNITELLDRTDVNVIATVQSNYDCQSSNYFSEYSGEDSYLRDVLDVLNINPKEFRQRFLERGLENIADDFPDIEERTGKNIVSIDSLVTELWNNTSPSLFIFANRMSVSDALDMLKDIESKEYLKVHKGTVCGLFSSFQGGGSCLECEVLEDSLIKIKGKDEYTYIDISEESTKHHYTINQVFGTYDSFLSKGGMEVTNGK